MHNMAYKGQKFNLVKIWDCVVCNVINEITDTQPHYKNPSLSGCGLVLSGGNFLLTVKWPVTGLNFQDSGRDFKNLPYLTSIFLAWGDLESEKSD